MKLLSAWTCYIDLNSAGTGDPHLCGGDLLFHRHITEDPPTGRENRSSKVKNNVKQSRKSIRIVPLVGQATFHRNNIGGVTREFEKVYEGERFVLKFDILYKTVYKSNGTAQAMSQVLVENQMMARLANKRRKQAEALNII